ncbi:MAG: purine-nucleoside phosphorylase [Christensenellales bacterium]|jgi:purine-nucleoside phosphorylase
MENYVHAIAEAAAYLKDRTGARPRIGFVLGSGWNILAEMLQNAVRVPYGDVPHMGRSTIKGHAGEWIFGEYEGRQLMMMNGRLHFYEGYSMKEATFPIRIMREMGCEIVILTNAAGAINTSFSAGDMVLITDHINLSGQTPLLGKNDDVLGVRFPDMSCAYDKALREAAREAAREVNLPLREGVYAMLTGPSYETPAEIRMLRTLGADCVGMSTVPETIAAVHGGMRVVAFSCMSNMAAGILDQPLTHQEVLETLDSVKEPFRRFAARFLTKL